MSDSSPREVAGEQKAQSGGGRSADGQVLLGKSIRINPREPLPHLDQGEVRAYAAVEQKPDRTVACYALICKNGLVPRRKSASIYKTIRDPGLMPLVGSGVVYWPPTNEQAYVFVHENIASAPILPNKSQLCLGWRQDRVLDVVFKSLFKAMGEMKQQEFFHGFISPANLFSVRGASDSVVLGGPLAVPAGYHQHVLCETIERGMAEPIGRGPATHSEDLYAFGATLALCMREPDPNFMARSPQEILNGKFEEGSYAFLIGRERLSGPMQDLLKGMLSDDPQQRWNIDDVAIWIGGKRPPSHQAQRKRKGARGLNFAGKNHFFVPELAFDAARDPELFSRVIEEGHIEQWLARSLDDKEGHERYETALKNVKNQGRDKNYSHLMTSYIRSALMPEWPLLYRGRMLNYEGFDTALAQAFEKGEDLKTFHELIEKSAFVNQLYMQEAKGMMVSRWLKVYEECRLALKQMRAGFGLERCLYLLNQNVNCLSPKLKGYFVTNAEELLYAFESIAEQGGHRDLFLDRQSIAFLCEVDSRCIDGFLYELNSPERHKQILGNIKCLAQVQKRYKVSSLPHLAKAFSDMLPYVYERFHDRTIRGNVEGQVKSAARAGDLAAIAAVLENEDTMARDMANYKRAMLEYYNLSLEHNEITEQMKNKHGFGRADAHAISAMVSGVIAFLLMVMAALSFVAGQAPSVF